MLNKSERSEGTLGRGIRAVLEEALRAEANQHFLKLNFEELTDLRMVPPSIFDSSDLGFLNADFEVKVTMIVGMGDSGLGLGGGYLVECLRKGETEPAYLVLGSQLDRNEDGGVVFISKVNEAVFSVSVRVANLYGQYVSREGIGDDSLVKRKISEIVNYASSFFGRQTGGMVRIPRPSRSRLAPPPRPRLRVNEPIVIRAEIGNVKSLSDEIAEVLKGNERVDIVNLPEDLSSKVKLSLEAGTVEITRLGVVLERMEFRGIYENDKTGERVYSVYGDGGENCRYVVQVVEAKTGELNLLAGLVVGIGDQNVSVMFNQQNNVVELAVNGSSGFARVDYSQSTGLLEESRGDQGAIRVLREYFPVGDYNFAKAFRNLLGQTRKTYGWLGGES